MAEIRVDATVENLDRVLAFVEGQMEALDASPRARMQVNIAVEEIFVNIAHYAYAPGTGSAVVRAAIEQDPPAIAITFVDSGIPYDPLAKPDPDVTASVKDRPIGGLGIFMVKKIMDGVEYRRQDGTNVLTIRKKLC